MKHLERTCFDVLSEARPTTVMYFKAETLKV